MTTFADLVPSPAGRFDGIERPYTPEDVLRLRGSVPITHTLAAVTVADKSTLRADGLSTLLMVMGTERGLAFAERMGIAAFFVTREGDTFVTQGTQAFEQLFAAGDEL